MDIKQNNKNNFYIDIVKGFAIFLMLWGHCAQFCYSDADMNPFNNFVVKFTCTFHMPLFMIISGYLFYYSFKKRELFPLIAHRCKPLLHTLVICGIFLYYISVGLFGVLAGNYEVLFNGEWLSFLSGLWFLWSVLSASLILSVVCKTINKLWLQIILLILCSFVVLFFPNAEKNLFMYPYFIIGFYFSKYKNVIPKGIINLKYLSFVLYPIMLIFYENKHYIYTTGMFGHNCSSFGEALAIDGFRYAIGLVGSIFALTIIEVIYNTITSKIRKPIIGLCLSKIGQYSLQIYAISTVLLSVYLPIIYSKTNLSTYNLIFIKNTLLYNFVFTVILSIAYSFLLYFCVKLLYKIKLGKFLFGR